VENIILDELEIQLVFITDGFWLVAWIQRLTPEKDEERYDLARKS